MVSDWPTNSRVLARAILPRLLAYEGDDGRVLRARRRVVSGEVLSLVDLSLLSGVV